jgi:NAD(P)-dependent dehydrogenase (short-subunit alcohol dehydrogenase family)
MLTHSKRRFAGKLALVTGAGSGIGRATALAFAAADAHLAICDVSEDGLAETASRARALGSVVLSRRVDVAIAEAMRAFAEEVAREAGVVDVLVNNAGVALGGGFLETPLEDWEWVLGVNLWGVVHGCHLFIPPMVARGAGGHVVNVASAAAYFNTDAMTAYGTTKYAVFGLSEALREELAPHGIGVSTICPGFVSTGIAENMRISPAHTEAERAKASSFLRRRGYGPERVAQAILDAVRDNRAVVPVTPEAWALYAAKRAFPSLALSLARRVVGAVLKS